MEEVEGGTGARFTVGCVADETDCMGYQSLTTFARRIEAAHAWNKRALVPWQPINTAPKDGSRFLAWCELKADELDLVGNVIHKDRISRYAVVAYFNFGTFVEFPWRGSIPQNLKFLNWRLLPDGPKEAP